MKHWIISYIAVCAVAVLSACNTASTQFTPTSSVFATTSQPTSSVNPVLQVTATATPKEKTALVPTKTLSPELVKMLTENEKEVAESEIKQLFQDNDTCPPPCYLGVVPGQTTSADLRNIFAKWGIKLHEGLQHTPSFYINGSLKGGFELNAEFLMKDNVVESIGFIVDQNEPYEWAAYSPTALLERYGVPSKVSFWIGSIHEPSPTPWKGWYYMIMSYDEMDLHIEYGGVEIRLDEKATVCPQKDAYGYGRVWLGKYPDFLGVPHVTYIEEAASISVQKFHDYVLSGPGACFYLDLSKVAFA